MAYRDDREADLARVDALEAELAQARERIAELEGHREQALVLASAGPLAARPAGPVARWFGAPLALELVRRFEGRYPPEQFEDLLGAIRASRRDRGRAEILRSSLTWDATPNGRNRTAPLTVTVTAEEASTTLTVQTRLHQLAGGIYGGVGGGVVGGAITLPLMLAISQPMLAPVIAVGWFGGVLLLTRGLFKRLAKRQAQTSQQLFERVAAEIEAGLRA